MKVIKKIAILIFVFILLLRIYSYHDKNDYSNIISIYYASYLEEYETKEYTDIADIKRISRRLRYINFYPLNNYVLSESPTSYVCIKYKDGKVKQFHFTGIYVMISANYGDLDRKAQFYIVNPLIVKRVFS